MKNKSSIYRIISILSVISLMVLFRCVQLPMDQSVFTGNDASVGVAVDTELEVVTDSEGNPIYSIADYDWEIKNHPYGRNDNLYELFVDGLNVSSSDTSIVALKAVDEQFLVICQDESLAAVVYMVNPLTMQITAFCNLPKGTYSDNGVRVNDKGEIEIWNQDNHELFVLNKKLQELEYITLKHINSDQIVISSDHKYVYYTDSLDGCVCCYQTEDGIQTRIFPDVDLRGDGFAMVLGLLKRDSCLAFRYYNKETKKDTYEIREISTGTVLYSDTAEISDIDIADGTYLLRHFEDGFLEILFGKEEDEMPKIISLRDYKEYEQIVMDIRMQSVISCQMKEDARVAYQELVDKGQEVAPDWWTQRVSLFTLQLYDMETGKRPYSLDLYYVHDLQDSPNCRMIYLQRANCIVCMMEGSHIRWLVWDLTKNSSKTGDDTDYIYQWQNPEMPDFEKLTQLTQRAEQIGQKNGVWIYFGESVWNVSNYYENKVSTNVIRIEKMLNILEKALDKYPEGMLVQLGEKSVQEGHLQIHLVSEIVPIGSDTLDDANGYQSSIDGIPYIVLDINDITWLEECIYHELFHVIEWELDYTKGVSNTGQVFFDEKEWKYLNPKGFKYDNSYEKNQRNYNDEFTVGTEDVYFIDIYSKSFPYEDRARIMEFAMLDVENEQRKYVESPGIQEKLKYICKEIRRGFDTTGWPEKTVWEMAVIE